MLQIDLQGSNMKNIMETKNCNSAVAFKNDKTVMGDYR